MLTRRTLLKSAFIAGGSLGLSRLPVFGKAVFRLQDNPPLYRFLFCNDIHVMKEADAEHLGKFIDDVNTVPDLFDFLVVCGDMGQVGTEDELMLSKTQLDRLKKPFYTVMGNHDVTGGSKADREPYYNTFGSNRENYVIEHKGVGHIYMDITNGKSSRVTVPQATVDWLKNALTKLDENLPLIVFNHFPLHKDAPEYTAVDADKIFNLLDSRNVLAYFNGHWHGRWKGQRNGTDHFCNACMSNSRDNHTFGPAWYKEKWEDMTEGYLLVDVFADGVGTTFYEYGQVPDLKSLPPVTIGFPKEVTCLT